MLMAYILAEPLSASMLLAAEDPPQRPPRLLDVLREQIRVRNFSIRTEQAYADWVKRFILFHGKRHPKDMGAAELEAFLSYLATQRNVSASTQNQARSAVLFLYRHVLNAQLPWLSDVVKAKASQHLPVVLTPHDVRDLAAAFSQRGGKAIGDGADCAAKFLLRQKGRGENRLEHPAERDQPEQGTNRDGNRETDRQKQEQREDTLCTAMRPLVEATIKPAEPGAHPDDRMRDALEESRRIAHEAFQKDGERSEKDVHAQRFISEERISSRSRSKDRSRWAAS